MILGLRGAEPRDVGEALGLSEDEVRERLKAGAEWSVRDAVKVAAALSTTVAFLVGETEDPRPVELVAATEPPDPPRPTPAGAALPVPVERVA